MHSKASSWKPSGSESVNESQKLLKSAEKYFYPTFSSFWAKLSSKKFFLMRSKILGLFDNSCLRTTSISEVIKRIYTFQLKSNYLENHKCLAPFSFPFFGIYIKFAMFWSRKKSHTSSISEVIESERCAYLNA